VEQFTYQSESYRARCEQLFRTTPVNTNILHFSSVYSLGCLIFIKMSLLGGISDRKSFWGKKICLICFCFHLTLEFT
jgi:hypothetical protein